MRAVCWLLIGLAALAFCVGTGTAFTHQAMILEPVQAAAGETIVTKGEMGDAMYIIVRGDVVVDDGAGRVIAELREGSYFGELSLLRQTPRVANVRAVSSCDLLALRKTDFDTLLGEHPELAAQLHEAAARYPKR